MARPAARTDKLPTRPAVSWDAGAPSLEANLTDSCGKPSSVDPATGFYCWERRKRDRCQSAASRGAIAGPSRIHQLGVLIIADDQRVEILQRRCVAADDQFLPLVHPHLLPGAGALAGFIASLPLIQSVMGSSSLGRTRSSNSLRRVSRLSLITSSPESTITSKA